ncbi:MAG: ABC transporter ATP-binding protein [Desulfobacterales bacterium]|nr:ABC transporter ATP-binding protein [Desulfobacterales bacterium]
MEIITDVDLSLGKGQTMALVGESGCGKSMTAMTLMRLLPDNAKITRGSIKLNGGDLTRLPEKKMRAVRGNDIAMIFQEPGAALDPLMTVGDQIMEAIRAHRDASYKEALERATRMLEMVGVPEPGVRMKQYPFELSGGMCQRIMIASALSRRPSVLITDEPTTALDVTIQAQILDLIRKMSQETGTAVIFITHDMGIVADMADQVTVMYAGRVVERGDVFQIFSQPRHPYTRLLLKSIPRIDGERKKKLHVIEGVVPDARRWPAGCRFHTRCPLADERCEKEAPALEKAGSDDCMVACWKPLSEAGEPNERH